MSIEYLKKARGTITAECRLPPVETSAKEEYEIPVTLTDERGDVVATGTVRSLVGPKQPPQA